MSGKRNKIEEAENTLGEVYCRQTALFPQEEWYRAVMRQVRQERLRETIMYSTIERAAYRIAWATVAAAAVVALVGFTTMPSEIDMVCDLQAGGAISEWAINAGE